MTTTWVAFVLLICVIELVKVDCFKYQEYKQMKDDRGELGQTVGITQNTPVGTVGKEFVFNFPTPYVSFSPIVMISTPLIAPVQVNVSVPGIGFYEETTTNRYQHAEIELPTTTYLQQGSSVQQKTVIVRADEDVSVYGMASEGYDPDGFLAIPTHGLGKNYIIATYGPTYSSDYPSEFSVSSLQEHTNIQIKTNLGQLINLTLAAYESYQVHDGYNDLTASVIVANKPIAVMAGSKSSAIPTGDGASMILEQLTSIDNFGFNFTLAPFMGRSSGYVYRIVTPSKVGITITNVGLIQLDEGQMYEGDVPGDSMTLITSDQPILVMQYMKGTRDGKGDTAMVTVPPTEMFAVNATFPIYDVTITTGYKYYINIVSECSHINGLTYDDTIPVADWETLYQGDMCVSRSEVTATTHSVGHVDPDATFSVTVYGFRHYHAFAYPVGFKVMSDIIPQTTPPAEPTTYLPTDEPPAEPTTRPLPTDELAIALECSNNTMAVFIPRNIISSVEAGDLHLIDESCTGEDYNNTHVRVSSTLDQCGTLTEVLDDYIVYSNVVLNDVIPVSPGIGFTRDRHVEIPVECYMERNGTSYVSFHPETSKIIFREEGFGKFSFQLQLYPDDEYNSPYPSDAYPIDVHLQDRLYFEAKVSAQDWLQLFINTCVATPTANPYSTPRFNFIKDGCPKDSTLEFYPSDDPLIQRFGWEALGAIDTDIPIYVHCFLMLCNASDPTSRCARGCQPYVNKRDVSMRGTGSGSKPYLMTEGPIRLLKKDKTVEKEGFIDEQQGNNILTVLVASFAFIILCLIAAMAIILKTKSNKMAATNGYQPVSTGADD